MTTINKNRHEHADILIAIANGETVQSFYTLDTKAEWLDNTDSEVFCILQSHDYNYKLRVKPEQQSRWMNIYYPAGPDNPEGGWIYPSKLIAEEQRDGLRKCVACIQITWTEGEGL